MATSKRIAMPLCSKSKVTPVAPLKKDTIRKITYQIEGEDISGEYSVHMTKTNYHQSFHFEVGDLPFCCGLVEIGSFTIRNKSTTHFTRDEESEGIRMLFAKFIEDSTHSNGSCTTSVFTLIDSPECNMVARALQGNSLYTPVKTFKNTNSRNLNILYVSNN